MGVQPDARARQAALVRARRAEGVLAERNPPPVVEQSGLQTGGQVVAQLGGAAVAFTTDALALRIGAYAVRAAQGEFIDTKSPDGYSVYTFTSLTLNAYAFIMSLWT
jgi:hypothetical protein